MHCVDCLSCVGNKNVNYTSTLWVPGEILFHEPVQHKEKNNGLMILFAVLLPGLMDNCFVKVL